MKAKKDKEMQDEQQTGFSFAQYGVGLTQIKRPKVHMGTTQYVVKL